VTAKRKSGERNLPTETPRKPGRGIEKYKNTLIICEGNRTEVNYFEALCKDIRSRSTPIEIKSGAAFHNDPERIIARALDLAESYDHVWVVFDDDARDRALDLAKKACDKDLSVAFSNPCFEVWYILHFENRTGPFKNSQAVKNRLKRKHIRDYRESMGVYDRILPHQQDALQRAESLRAWLIDNAKLETDNPSSSVDRLVVFLQGLKASR
jgi:hypothetical protein